jgi:hypothetical protein
MSVQLIGYNVVIAARFFNPSVFNQLWLVRNGLVKEEEFENACVFTEAFVQIKTPRFLLTVVPEQLQFLPLNQNKLEQEVIVEKLDRRFAVESQ